MYNNRSTFLRQRRSSALVITLAMLVLISALIVVFLNQSTLNRQISFSSSGQFRADFMAHSAMDTIVGDLRTEIIAGSTPTSTAGGNIYVPIANSSTTNLFMVPCRVADQGFTNLVAQSASTSNFWKGANYTMTGPIRSAANNSTATPSANGRYIAFNRWNKPGLLGDLGSKAVPQLTNNSPLTGNAYIPPDWVLVTRQGAATNGPVLAALPLSTLADKNATNSNYVIGRYAYAIYDEGGLLDVNVAGYPNASSTTANVSSTPFSTQRGLLPQVDLANLFSNPAINDANASVDANNLVTWRNAATASSSQLYTNYVLYTTNGFLSVAEQGQQVTATINQNNTVYTVGSPGDQAFIGRQDLINYIKNNGSIPTAALQYLGTFTRDSTGPSYYPEPTRPKVNRNGTNDDIINPSVLAIRTQAGIPRSDGTTSVAGEPLLKHRFPLSRLALFQNLAGTTGGQSNLALIKKYFAMQPGTAANNDVGLWDYVDPDTGAVATTLPTIKTLADVVDPSNPTYHAREADFWELLQAGILTGSLGANNGTFNGFDTSADASTTRQILAIGLNIIDQYSPATTPPTPFVLNLGGPAPSTGNNKDLFVASEENLPYISWIAINYFRDMTSPPVSVPPASQGTNRWLDGYFQFALWNPHRIAVVPPTAKFQIVCSGQTYINVQNTQTNVPSATPMGGTSSTNSWSLSGSKPGLAFQTTASRYFNPISTLGPSDAVLGSTSPLAQFPSPPLSSGVANEVGLLMGQVPIEYNNINYEFPTPFQPGGPPNSTEDNKFASTSPPGLTLVLEVQVGGNWIPYQILPNYQALTGGTGLDTANLTASLNALNGFAPGGTTALPNWSALICMAHSDPRTGRLGLGLGSSNNNVSGDLVHDTAQSMLENACNFIDSASTPANAGFYYNPFPVPGGVNPPQTNTVFADYAYNLTNIPSVTTSGVVTVHSYPDPDGVVRKGDSNPTTTEISTDTHGADSPFANANPRPMILNRPFTSVAELGNAYRDVPWRSLNFSSQDSADGGLLDLFSVNEVDSTTRAGVLDLNGASQPVLAAIMMGNYQDPLQTTTTLYTFAQANNIASGIRSALGPPDAPTMILRNVADIPALIQQIASSLPSTYKYRREGVARSFADIANTRTWNLMIDVIAQAGRYTSTSKSLNDFVVEGERRYWIHIAIDRLTGQVVDSQIEPVSE